MNNNQEQNKLLQEWKLKYTILNPLILILMGLILIALGIVSQTADVNYQYIETRYDQDCAGKASCQIKINVPSNMKSPVFFSFEITSFFQNTDKYFRSIPYGQLYGDEDFDTSICDQYKTNSEMKKTKSVDGKDLNPNDIAIPCGIAAYSYMNDNYIIKNGQGTEISISNQGIAWPSDIGKFKNVNLSKQWTDMKSGSLITLKLERFINWMRPSPLSKFRKLWGRIDSELTAGDYTVDIAIGDSQSDAYSDTKKYVLLHNNGQFSDPILVITLPCLCVGPFLVIFGIINVIYWSRKDQLVKKYSVY